MPKFITLTPSNSHAHRKVCVNCNAIESVFFGEDGAHITFIGVESSWLDVKESGETVMQMISEES